MKPSFKVIKVNNFIGVFLLKAQVSIESVLTTH